MSDYYRYNRFFRDCASGDKCFKELRQAALYGVDLTAEFGIRAMSYNDLEIYEPFHKLDAYKLFGYLMKADDFEKAWAEKWSTIMKSRKERLTQTKNYMNTLSGDYD